MAGIGSTPELVAAAAVGAAAGAALEPAFEVPRQDAWTRLPNRILGVGLLAQLVAQGGVLLGNPDGSTAGSAYDEALRQGYTSDKLDRLIYLAQTAPDLAMTLELWRRGLLGDPTGKVAVALVEHAFAKHQIEPQYWSALEELFSGRLDPALIATMVQRSVLPNASNAAGTETLLPFSIADAAAGVYQSWNASVTTQTTGTAATGHNVTPMPQVPLDVLAEARAHGIDFERLAAETRIVGLPAAPDLAARMTFRGIITANDFAQAIAEGNARVEWAPAIFDGYREILTAHDYAELQLRGYYDRPTRLKKTLQHGMRESDSDDLYDVLGRAINPHQVTIGHARGGVYNGDTSTIPDHYVEALQRGNIRPEWYDLAFHAEQYNYPSAFVLRTMSQQGEITPGQTDGILLSIGWPPWLAAKVTESWTGAALHDPAVIPETYADAIGSWTAPTTGGDKHVSKAQTSLFSATHRSYVAEEIDDAAATTALTAAGVQAASIPGILTVWQAERALIRKQLSPTQIRKAVSGAVINPATGVAWTHADAMAALLARGYDQNDAETFLAE